MIDSKILDLILKSHSENINVGKLLTKLSIDDKTYNINVKWLEERLVEELTEIEARKLARENRGYWPGYDIIKVDDDLYHKIVKTNHDICNIHFINDVTLKVFDRNNIHIFDNNLKLGVKMKYDNKYTRSLVKIVDKVCEAYKQRYKDIVDELKGGHINHKIYLNVLEDITKEPQIENSL